MEKTKMFLTALSVMLLALSQSVFADEYPDNARVIGYTPIVKTAYKQVKKCHYEIHQKSSRRDTGDRVIGGLLGGLAGSTIGKGSGRDAAAAVGAIVGSEVADGDGITEGEIFGGIVGGLLGNQIGKGRGKTAATAAGALIGSIVGNNTVNGQQIQETRRVRVCNLSQIPRKIITGYEVIYEYAGSRHYTELSYIPGKTIEVWVNVNSRY